MPLYIDINIPPCGIEKEALSIAAETINATVAAIRDDTARMRNYLYGAKKIGFEVAPDSLAHYELEPWCLKAAWWGFEKLIWDEYHALQAISAKESGKTGSVQTH